MSARVYGYLRASTDEQDANRAKGALINFAKTHDFEIAAWFIEVESGAKLYRPELFRLLDIAQPGDVLLVEQIDRISRLKAEDWESLKGIINGKGIRVVSIDLPTSHQLLCFKDEFTNRMLEALNTMMLDVLAAVARKDYDDRLRRQKEGIKKRKEAGLYRGRPPDYPKLERITDLLVLGQTYDFIQDTIPCARGTVAKVSNQMKQIAEQLELGQAYDTIQDVVGCSEAMIEKVFRQMNKIEAAA